jgi:phage/plasmid-associated DNA primase
VKFKDVYACYQKFCAAEGYQSYEKKREFRKRLEDFGYRIETSTKNNNSVCVFGVTIADEKE